MRRETESVAAEPGAAGQGAGRPLRFVFSLLHAGYLRHYAEPIHLLAERGHAVHIVLWRFEEGDRDLVLLKQLLEQHPSVTVARAPRRRHADGWRGLAWLVRGLVDVLRYADPRYDDTPALRERAAEKVRSRVAASRVDVITRWVVGRALAFVSSRPPQRVARRYLRALATVELAIPTSRRVDRLLAGYEPDAVLASPVVDIASPQVEFIKSAMRRGVPAAVCVASWDNLTSKGLLRVVPDRVLVWNEIQRTELAEMHSVPPERVVVTGGQKFDAWFDRRPSTSREEFAAKVGLDPDRGYLLYLCSSAFIAPDELGFVRRWLDALRASGDAHLRDLGVLIRPHPQNPGQWLDPDLSGYENVVVWPRGGQHPDAGDAQAGFFDSMAHSTAVVGINTSAQIDAAIVGKPVYTVRAFDVSQDGTIHFHYLLHENGGFVRDAESLDEHLRQLAEGLDDTSGRADELRRFIEAFVRPRGIDRPASPLVADEIERLAYVEPQHHSRAALLAVRALLYPLVVAMALASAPVGLWHRLRRRLPHGSQRRSAVSAEPG